MHRLRRFCAHTTMRRMRSALCAERTRNSRRVDNLRFSTLLGLHPFSLFAPEALLCAQKKIRAGKCVHTALIADSALPSSGASRHLPPREGKSGAVSFDCRFTARIEPEGGSPIGDLEREPGAAKGKRRI